MQAPYPIWSLSTKNKDNETNMNICSYVVPISMKPKEFMVALYYNTQTYENVRATRRGCLQLLAHDQYNLVRPLGKVSARTKSHKLKKLYATDAITTWHHWDVLRNVIGYVELEFYDIQKTTTDHAIGYARMITYRMLRDDDVLMTRDLYDRGIIG